MIVADQLIVAATSATIEFQAVNSDGEPVDPGTVTVTVARSDGTVIAVAQPVSGILVAPRTFQLTPADTSLVDRLSAAWTADGIVVGRTVIDIVGRPLITRAEFNQRAPRRATADKEDFLQARREAWDLVNNRANRAFVPTFAVETVTASSSTLFVRYPDVTEVRWVLNSSGTPVDASSMMPNTAGMLNGGPWYGNVTVGYVHGMNRPPEDLLGALATLIDAKIADGTSSIAKRAESITTEMGSVSFVPRAGYGKAITAIDQVDEAIHAHEWRPAGIA